jgi:hypothetical protein
VDTLSKDIAVLPVSVKGIVFEGNAVWLRKNERNESEESLSRESSRALQLSARSVKNLGSSRRQPALLMHISSAFRAASMKTAAY